MKTAAVYMRVGTMTALEKVNSTVRQDLAIRDFAAKNGYNIKYVFVDSNVSGNSLDRPCLKDMLSTLADNPVDAVLVYSGEVLSRNVHHHVMLTHEIRRLGAALVFTAASQPTLVPPALELFGRAFLSCHADRIKNVMGEDMAVVEQALLAGFGQDTITLPYSAVDKMHDLLTQLLED